LEKDLKGKTFSDLIKQDSDAIAILPFYTSEDRKTTLHANSKSNNAWLITEEFGVDGNEKEVNSEMLTSLTGGVNSVLLYVYDHVDFSALLKDIELSYIQIHLVIEGDPLKVISNLKSHIRARGWEEDEIQGTINWDVLENRARLGKWFTSKEADFQILKEVLDNTLSGMKSLAVNVNLFHNAGATPVQELAIGLAMINEYAEHLPKGSFDSVWLNYAIGGQYFHDIAKLRAVRELFAFYQSERGLKLNLRLHAETGTYNKSVFDMYNNMIRNTVETAAAVVGGADEVLTKPHDQLVKSPSTFSRRIARNNQMLLLHESHMHQTVDPAKGSYFIEELTREMAEKAWELFVEMEEKGGFISLLESGELSEMIRDAHEMKKESFEKQERVLVGVNKFPNNADKAFESEFTAPRESAVKDKIVPVRLARDWEYEMWKKREQ
jgi:methylmalonyl-CoA mutase